MRCDECCNILQGALPVRPRQALVQARPRRPESLLGKVLKVPGWQVSAGRPHRLQAAILLHPLGGELMHTLHAAAVHAFTPLHTVHAAVVHVFTPLPALTPSHTLHAAAVHAFTPLHMLHVAAVHAFTPLHAADMHAATSLCCNLKALCMVLNAPVL